ncbi:MAG: PilZ domain-containing protein [Terracidiphilus sp.]
MESPKYCVYNQTRESFLSLGVTVADITVEKLRAMIERLTIKADSGLWMMPYRGIPSAKGLSPIDLLYLDKDYRVIQEVESFPTASVEPLRDEAASALVLPAHTIYSSQTQPGDQLVICVAHEMERRLERLAESFSTTPHSQTSAANGDRTSGVAIESPPIFSDRSSILQLGEMASKGVEPAGQPSSRPNAIKAWFQQLLSPERRRAKRLPLPGLVAYYWTGTTPRAYQVADISMSGLYLLTEERWYPGTLVLMTLQRVDNEGRNLDDAVAVQSRVIRWGTDGLGLSFVLSKSMDPDKDGNWYGNCVDKKSLERFLGRLKDAGKDLRTVFD